MTDRQTDSEIHTMNVFSTMLSSTCGRSLSKLTQPHPSLSHNLGAFSFFSTAPSAASKKPSPINHYDRFILPTTLLPTSQPPAQQPRVVDGELLKSALQDLKRQKEEISNLEKLMDTMRIARLPTSTTTPTSGGAPTQQQPQQQGRTFQVMNRNARKPKRANHGKRPCSRVRRRWKVKSWANTSRRG